MKENLGSHSKLKPEIRFRNGRETETIHFIWSYSSRSTSRKGSFGFILILIKITAPITLKRLIMQKNWKSSRPKVKEE